MHYIHFDLNEGHQLSHVHVNMIIMTGIYSMDI